MWRTLSCEQTHVLQDNNCFFFFSHKKSLKIFHKSIPLRHLLKFSFLYMLGYEIPIIKEVFVIARCIFLTIPFMWRDVLAYFLLCCFLIGLVKQCDCWSPWDFGLKLHSFLSTFTKIVEFSPFIKISEILTLIFPTPFQWPFFL